VLNGTAQFSALSKYLVPNGRQVLRKGVKLGGSATTREDKGLRTES
jgi:hypothetical protein